MVDIESCPSVVYGQSIYYEKFRKILFPTLAQANLSFFSLSSSW